MRYSLLFLVGIYPLFSYATTTELKLFRPFGEVVAQIKPRVKVELNGTCLQQSQRIARDDAWRCMAEGINYDPCFVAIQNPQQALCLQSPWQSEAILINSTKNLNNDGHKMLDLSTAYPWAVELESKVQCVASDFNQQIGADVVHYQCTDHSVLLGYLQRCKTQWSMLRKYEDDISTVVIKKAWF